MGPKDHSRRWPNKRRSSGASLPGILSTTAPTSTDVSGTRPTDSTSVTVPSTTSKKHDKQQSIASEADSGGSSQATGAQSRASTPRPKPIPRPVQYQNLTPEEFGDFETGGAVVWADEHLNPPRGEHLPVPPHSPRSHSPPRHVESQQRRATAAPQASAAPSPALCAVISLVACGVLAYVCGANVGVLFLTCIVLSMLVTIPVVAIADASDARVILFALIGVLSIEARARTLVAESPLRRLWA